MLLSFSSPLLFSSISHPLLTHLLPYNNQTSSFTHSLPLLSLIPTVPSSPLPFQSNIYPSLSPLHQINIPQTAPPKPSPTASKNFAPSPALAPPATNPTLPPQLRPPPKHLPLIRNPVPRPLRKLLPMAKVKARRLLQRAKRVNAKRRRWRSRRVAFLSMRIRR